MESSSTTQSNPNKIIQPLQTTLTTAKQKTDKIINALKSHYKTHGRLESLLSNHTQSITDINLSITETKKISSKKETKSSKETKRSQWGLTHSQALEEYEQEYNVTAIAVKDIFKKREIDKVPPKRLLILGRAGIGKSTMSQYFAYEWSHGKLWNDDDGFDYLFWVPLRKLAGSDYQTATDLSLATIVHQECLNKQDQDNITIEDIKKLFKEQNGRCLFLLDGHDEIVTLLREHSKIKGIYDQMLKMEYVILTSRPYSLQDTELFQRRLENMGFTDQNIKDYVKRYFTSLEESKEKNYEEKGSGEKVAKECLTFLEANPSLWGSAHVPINLALIVESWQQAQQEEQKEGLSSFSKDMGLTQLYQIITRYLVKRCLEKRKVGQTKNQSDAWIYKQVESELAYLERLAFTGLEQTTRINIESKTQRKILTEIEKIYSNSNGLFNHVLQLGFLKTVTENKKEEIDKAHYFIHLTFQEFFAARYLIDGLKQATDSKRHQAVLQFLRDEKYNPRYQIVLGFMAGLLSAEPECMVQQEEKQDKSKKVGKKITTLHLFWNSLLAQPLDISGAGHLHLLIRCFEEAKGDNRIPYRNIIIHDIKQWAKAAIYNPKTGLRWLFQLLSVQPHVMEIIALHKLIQDALSNDNKIIRGQATEVLSMLSEQRTLPEFNELIETLCQKAEDKKEIDQRRIALELLSRLDEKAVSDPIKNIFCEAFNDQENEIKNLAIGAAYRFNIKIITDQLISSTNLPLISPNKNNAVIKGEKGILQTKKIESGVRIDQMTQGEIKNLYQQLIDTKREIRVKAQEKLAFLEEGATLENVVTALIQGLEDKEWYVRANAAEALGWLGGRAASQDVVAALLQALGEKEYWVRSKAAEALGWLGEKAANGKVLAALVQALGDKDEGVRRNAAKALGQSGEKAANEGVVAALAQALEDKDEGVRRNAAKALGQLGEKAANERVVAALAQALQDKDEGVQRNAAKALGQLVAALAQALGDKEREVQESAAEALRRLIKNLQVSHTLLRLLMEKLEYKNSEKAFRLLAAVILGLGQLDEKEDRNEVLRVLHRTLKDSDQAVALEVAIALVNFGERTNLTEITKILCQNLRNDKIKLDNKRKIITALAQLGEKALVLPGVKEVLQVSQSDKDSYVCEQAAKALGQLNLTNLVSRYLKDKNTVSAKTLAEIALQHGASVVINYDKNALQYKIHIEEGANKLDRSLTSHQAIELREAFVMFNQLIKPSSSHLSYSFLIDNWTEDKNYGAYILKSAFGKQAVKIELNYEHDLCKKAPFDVLSTVLKTLDHKYLHYLDLSDNRLTDQVGATLAVRYIAKNNWPNLRTLKLSNNQLSVKGLCYLLRELSPNSSLKFLDVDQNRITCEAKQFQEKLEPFIKKAQLERLDLSLNFIEKGKLLPVSTQISSLRGSSKEEKVKTISYKAVCDKNTLEGEVGKKSRLYCKSFFFNNALNVQSTIQKTNTDDLTQLKSVLSLLNLSQKESKEPLEINKSHGVVALLANKSPHFFDGQHAFLVLEYLHTFGQRSIITGDLFYKETETTKKISIRVAHVSPQEFLDRVHDGESVYSNVARVEKKYIKEMIKKMCQSRDKQDFGKYAAIFTKNGVYNCLTWAVGILEEAQIVKDISHWRPSDNIAQESRCLVM